MIPDQPHHNLMTPNIAPYFSVLFVWVMGIWCQHLLLLIEIEVYGIL